MYQLLCVEEYGVPEDMNDWISYTSAWEHHKGTGAALLGSTDMSHLMTSEGGLNDGVGGAAYPSTYWPYGFIRSVFMRQDEKDITRFYSA